MRHIQSLNRATIHHFQSKSLHGFPLIYFIQELVAGACKLLDVLDGSWSIHGHDEIDLLWISLNSSVTDDESE